MKKKTMMVPEAKREKRKKKTAENFTPPQLIRDMLSALPPEVWQENKTFCDLACGNGLFLSQIITRKIEKGHSPLSALKTTYGVDIKKDNVNECRGRLLKIIEQHEELTPEHIEAVVRNVVRDNSLTSHLKFRKPKAANVKEFCRDVLKRNILKDVPLVQDSEYNGEKLTSLTNNTQNVKPILQSNRRTIKGGKLRNTKSRNQRKRTRSVA